MILVGSVTAPSGDWLEWPVDADRVVRTMFTRECCFFTFTNGPGFETHLGLSPEAVAVLFAALHYEIVGDHFDATIIKATPDDRGATA